MSFFDWTALAGLTVALTALLDRVRYWRMLDKAFADIREELKECREDRRKLWERIGPKGAKE